MPWRSDYGPSPLCGALFGAEPDHSATFESWEEFGKRWRAEQKEWERREHAEAVRQAEDSLLRGDFALLGMPEEMLPDAVALFRLLHTGEPGLLQREKVRLVLAGEMEMGNQHGK